MAQEQENRYDITVRVNLTMEYDNPQRASHVQQDAHDLLERIDLYALGLHLWACEVTGGKATVIDGRFALPGENQ